MKVFIVILFFGFASVSFAEPGCVDSAVFVKKAECVDVGKQVVNQEGKKEYTVLKNVLPAKTVLQQAVADRMLVFATNSQPTYTALSPTEKFGIEFNRSSVRLGVRKTF